MACDVCPVPMFFLIADFGPIVYWKSLTHCIWSLTQSSQNPYPPLGTGEWCNNSSSRMTFELLEAPPAFLPPCLPASLSPHHGSAPQMTMLIWMIENSNNKLREIHHWRHILQRCLKFKFTYIIKNFKLCYLSQSLVIWKAFPRIQFS